MEEQRTPRPDNSSADEPMVTPVERPRRAHPLRREIQVGDTIAGYVLKDAVGEGGMGRVYLAHDARLDRFVALKLLPPEDSDEESRARFLREARALARVEHPNVVRVHASGVDDDVAWMALEYIEGDPLDEVLGDSPLDEETALLLCAQAARGLAAVHGVGVVHRDVKPGNLLIDDEGTLRVVDFGVALMKEGNAGGFVTQAGIAVGTPHFMAPEQVRGGDIDGRADAWGLGATLFMMLAGKPPFWTEEEESDLDILARVLRDKAPDIRKRAPGVSAETAAVLRRLLARKSADRLDDLEEVAALLEACADHLTGRGPMPNIEALPAEPAPAEDVPAPAEPPPPSPPSTLLRLGLLGATLLVVLLATGVGWLIAANGDDDSSTTTIVRTQPRPRPDPAPEVESAPSVDPEPAVVEPLPSPAELEMREATALRVTALAGGTAGDDALMRLVDLKTGPAEEAVLEVAAQRSHTARVVEVIGRKGARHHLRTLTFVLLNGEPAVAAKTTAVLASMKSAKALELLRAAEASHPNSEVRRAAKTARRSIFSFEGEDADGGSEP